MTEQQLIRRLLQFYEPSVRPVHQAQATVNISFRMEITQLFELVRRDRRCFSHLIRLMRFFFLGRKNTDLNNKCSNRTEMDRC